MLVGNCGEVQPGCPRSEWPTSFGPGADAEELRHVVRDFLRRHNPEHAVRRIAESETGYDPAVWAQAAQELGLHGLVIPERLGGGGATPVELGVVFEELGDVLFADRSSPRLGWPLRRFCTSVAGAPNDNCA
jgi:alkylation response protein AidB-like acyl-CoA dehydrogenase